MFELCGILVISMHHCMHMLYLYMGSSDPSPHMVYLLITGVPVGLQWEMSLVQSIICRVFCYAV